MSVGSLSFRCRSTNLHNESENFSPTTGPQILFFLLTSWQHKPLVLSVGAASGTKMLLRGRGGCELNLPLLLLLLYISDVLGLESTDGSHVTFGLELHTL